MIRHELYFQKQRDARQAFHLLTMITLEGVVSEYQVTFFTNRALTLLEQVIMQWPKQEHIAYRLEQPD
jgi:hypothetical protein